MDLLFWEKFPLASPPPPPPQFSSCVAQSTSRSTALPKITEWVSGSGEIRARTPLCASPLCFSLLLKFLSTPGAKIRWNRTNSTVTLAEAYEGHSENATTMLWHQTSQTEWCSVIFMPKGMGISISPWLYSSFSTHWPLSTQSDSTARCSKMPHFYSFPENWQPDKEESWKWTTRYRKKWLIHSIGHQQTITERAGWVEGGMVWATRGLWLHLHKEAKEGWGSSTSMWLCYGTVSTLLSTAVTASPKPLDRDLRQETGPGTRWVTSSSPGVGGHTLCSSIDVIRDLDPPDWHWVFLLFPDWTINLLKVISAFSYKLLFLCAQVKPFNFWNAYGKKLFRELFWSIWEKKKPTLTILPAVDLDLLL